MLELTSRLEQVRPGLIAKFPPQHYIARAGRLAVAADTAGFRLWSVRPASASPVRPDRTRWLYHRLVLSTLISHSINVGSQYGSRVDTWTVCDRGFSRILAQFDKAKRGFYLHGNDLFAKGPCDLPWLLPCGTWLVGVLSGVPRRLSGQRQRGWMRLTSAGTSRRGWVASVPLRNAHWTRARSAVHARGWDRCYLRIADLLELNRDSRRVWQQLVVRPEAEQVTPNIGFPSATPTQSRCADLPRRSRRAAVREQRNSRGCAEGSASRATICPQLPDGLGA